MELVTGVSLYNYLKTKTDKKLEESDAKDIYYQIVKGMNYLHTNNIIHRDLKLENIILDDKKRIKIIDFGFGTITTNDDYSNFFCGTPSYMPPEIVGKKDYIGMINKIYIYINIILLGSYADIWTLGILLYYLICGFFPFRGLNEKDLYKKILKGQFTMPDTISTNASKLLKLVLKTDPKVRPSCEEVIKLN